MIRLENVFFAYSGSEKTILNNINLSIEKGEFVAVAGQNGAGKSTLLKLLNGLLKPQNGTVSVCGLDTRENSVSEMAKHIGFLFQNADSQIFSDTVYNEIAFGLRALCFDNIDERVRAAAKKLSLSEKLDKSPFELSKGERQKTALCGVLAVESDVIVLDEPTAGQDYAECMDIMNIVSELNQGGKTVLIVSHDMEIVSDFAKRTVLLKNGEIISDANTEDVLKNEAVLLETGLKPPQIIELSNRFSDFSASNVSQMLKQIQGRLRV